MADKLRPNVLFRMLNRTSSVLLVSVMDPPGLGAPHQQAISLDFLGVPGSALGCDTLSLVSEHGFPADKRLGAGVVDGRSVWRDGDAAAAIVAALLEMVHPRRQTGRLAASRAAPFGGLCMTLLKWGSR
jgi:5-methyltetrahydropteroyltriglutamate--homocysteine methyltransferase